jgi:hypothetical protein
MVKQLIEAFLVLFGGVVKIAVTAEFPGDDLEDCQTAGIRVGDGFDNKAGERVPPGPGALSMTFVFGGIHTLVWLAFRGGREGS